MCWLLQGLRCLALGLLQLLFCCALHRSNVLVCIVQLHATCLCRAAGPCHTPRLHPSNHNLLLLYCTPCCHYPGISAHQKLELLGSLVRLLGYEGVSVFGDCFDEVTLLDPVRFPGG